MPSKGKKNEKTMHCSDSDDDMLNFKNNVNTLLDEDTGSETDPLQGNVSLKSDDSSDEGDDFIQQSIKRQQQQMKKQDEGLEMLATSAQKLNEMSLNINDELDYQNKMLNEMDDELEGATDNLDLITRKTKEMIEKSGGTSNFMCIV